MRQFTTEQQTANLIDLGFEKPRALVDKYYDYDAEAYVEVKAYSIGELIEMLPTHINWTPRVILLNSIEYSFGAVDSELFIFNLYDELIDNLFDAVVKLKEEGVI